MRGAVTVTECYPFHHHHWIIEEASGPTSVGICRYCNARRQFKNWLAETDFITNVEYRSLRGSTADGPD
jgi:hypothetical protein